MKTPFPERLKPLWYSMKNKGLTYDDLSAGSNQVVWWLNKNCGHEWDNSVKKQNAVSVDCLVCSGSRILTDFNDLGTLAPELASQWHPTKNEGVDFRMVGLHSNKEVWWLDSACGHEWPAIINNRSKGAGCSVCAGKRPDFGVNDLATLHPAIAAQWHPIKNGDLTPAIFLPGSNKAIYWLCEVCDFDWPTRIQHRVSGSGCPRCAGNAPVKVADNFVVNKVDSIVQWHPTLNERKVSEVSRGMRVDASWVCQRGHVFNAMVYHRTGSNSACPICSNQKVHVGFNDLATTHPGLMRQWDSTLNGGLEPTDVVAGSENSIFWKCEVCAHVWQTAIKERTRLDHATGCPACTGKSVQVGVNDLKTTHPALAAQWNNELNKVLRPEDLTYGSHELVWWNCDKGHNPWLTRVNHRAIANSNCPKCVNPVSLAEKELAAYVESLGFVIDTSNRSVLKHQEIDIYIAEKKLGIEFNGLYWHSEAHGKGKQYHYNKWLEAKNAGVQLIQIWEDDWVRQPSVVKNLLAHKLGVSQQAKLAARKTVVAKVTKVEAAAFLALNHVQAYASGSYYLGLKSEDNLVALLVVKKESNGDFNIVRYATSANVVGGFTKLLTYVERGYKPTRFITFSDHMVSDGGLYEKNGFTADKEIRPDYMYLVNGERKHKFGYRLKKFRDDPKLKFDSTLSERELAVLNNLPRIWDAGKTRWVKNIPTK